MMLTKQERADLELLVGQFQNDIDYMSRWVADPDSHFTRGICDRHRRMALWLATILRTNETSLSVDAVDPVGERVTE